MIQKFRKMMKKAKDNRGFTLIELLMVIVVIGILAGIGIPAYKDLNNKAMDRKVQGTASNLATALELYFSDYNAYPAPADDLTILKTEGYIKKLDTGLVLKYPTAASATPPAVPDASTTPAAQAHKIFYWSNSAGQYKIFAFDSDTDLLTEY